MINFSCTRSDERAYRLFIKKPVVREREFMVVGDKISRADTLNRGYSRGHDRGCQPISWYNKRSGPMMWIWNLLTQALVLLMGLRGGTGSVHLLPLVSPRFDLYYREKIEDYLRFLRFPIFA